MAKSGHVFFPFTFRIWFDCTHVFMSDFMPFFIFQRIFTFAASQIICSISALLVKRHVYVATTVANASILTPFILCIR